MPMPVPIPMLACSSDSYLLSALLALTPISPISTTHAHRNLPHVTSCRTYAYTLDVPNTQCYPPYMPFAYNCLICYCLHAYCPLV